MIQSCKQFDSIHGPRSLSNDTKNSISNQEENSISSNATDSTKSIVSSDTESEDGTPIGIPARSDDYNQNNITEDECEEADNSEKSTLKDAVFLSEVCSSSLEKRLPPKAQHDYYLDLHSRSSQVFHRIIVLPSQELIHMKKTSRRKIKMCSIYPSILK